MRSEGPQAPLAVMAKPVGSRCNMRCTYCYYLEKGKYSENKKQTRMSFDLLEKLIRQTIAASPGPVVSFTWHGGEPTLAGMDFYKKALELEKKYLPKGWEAWNNLQTNGLLLNEGWCRFLKENRFDVGLSIDGSMEVHDSNRRLPGGAGTFARVSAAIRRLREHGLEPDLLCTVNAASQDKPLEVYRALRETGCAWVQFIPVVIRSGEDLPWALMAITRSRIGWAWAKNAFSPGHSQYCPGWPSALRPNRSLRQPPLQKRSQGHVRHSPVRASRFESPKARWKSPPAIRARLPSRREPNRCSGSTKWSQEYTAPSSSAMSTWPQVGLIQHRLAWPPAMIRAISANSCTSKTPRSCVTHSSNTAVRKRP